MEEKYFSEDNLRSMLEIISSVITHEENEWFKDELKLILLDGKSDSIMPTKLVEIKEDTNRIINYLDISPDCCVDYTFINLSALKNRLVVDNIRMENVRYDMSQKDEMQRLYDYIINAFYQIEALINYYYYVKFPIFNELLDYLETIPGSTFKRGKERNIGDIAIYNKIFCFNLVHYPLQNNKLPDDFTGFNIDNLRQIRNEGSHRMIITLNSNDNTRLYKFLKNTTLDSVKATIISFAAEIKESLQFHEQKNTINGKS